MENWSKKKVIDEIITILEGSILLSAKNISSMTDQFIRLIEFSKMKFNEMNYILTEIMLKGYQNSLENVIYTILENKYIEILKKSMKLFLVLFKIKCLRQRKANHKILSQKLEPYLILWENEISGEEKALLNFEKKFQADFNRPEVLLKEIAKIFKKFSRSEIVWVRFLEIAQWTGDFTKQYKLFNLLFIKNSFNDFQSQIFFQNWVKQILRD